MSKVDGIGRHSRRQFLALTGATAGLAVAGAGWAENRPQVNAAAVTGDSHETDVLVIGGGMAGLFAAIKAHDAGARVLLVSKGRLGSSGQTPFAKGFFVYDPTVEETSVDDFVATVSRSALGTNNPVFTRQVAEHSLVRAEELRDWGFFDQSLCHRSFQRPVTERGIPLMERVMVTHLVRQGDRIAGAAGFRLDAEEIVTIRARAVILCTGAGGFKPAGFPICDLTHDGTVMAYRIGARVTGKEWNDGHVTRATNPAACYDNWGDMFGRVPSTTGVEVHHDLGVEANYQAYVAGNPLPGGPPGAAAGDAISGGPIVPAEFQRRPPGGASDHPPPEGRGKGGGPGGGKGGPPGNAMHAPQLGGASAGMAIHKSEGLVPIDAHGASTIPGLFAAGDALGSHMAGGIYTQVGSSLAGSAVQGAVAGAAAADHASGVELADIPAARLDGIRDEILAPLRRHAGYGPDWVTRTLQGVMTPNFVLYVKKAPVMQGALAMVEELRDHHVPMLRAADMHELRLTHETANMVLSAEMKLRASLMREESRCSHYRLDFPETDDANWRAWINIFRGEDGTMQLEKQPFDRWPELA